jgi:hypothetical protein
MYRKGTSSLLLRDEVAENARGGVMCTCENAYQQATADVLYATIIILKMFDTSRL